MKKRLKYIINGILLIMTAVLIYTASTAFSIWSYGNVDEKCKADAAIVLGAATYNGKVCPVFAERINHGVWLYQQGYVKKLILTGGYGKGNQLSDSYTAKLYAEAQGVPSKDILIEEKSTLTQENIMYAKELMEYKNIKTVIFVSDPLHMKRAMLIATAAGIEAYSSPTPTSRYVSLKSKLTFLKKEMILYTAYKILTRVSFYHSCYTLSYLY